MMALRLQLPPVGALTANGDSDPLPFYYKPLVGRLFAARLNIGLALLDGRFKRVLEIGYGSGLLMPTLASISDQIYGLDLAPEPAGLRARLQQLGVQPEELVQADVKRMPFAAGHFDGVIAFSIFEHLKSDELAPALAEVARVLEPGGRFLVGCPAVHKIMNAAFSAIGFANIEQHHFSTIADVLAAAQTHFTVERHDALPGVMRRLPLGWAPYTTVLLRRR
jgi:ubiquinone/menaquinone biosynthesis C-methylase UbiE